MAYLEIVRRRGEPVRLRLPGGPTVTLLVGRIERSKDRVHLHIEAPRQVEVGRTDGPREGGDRAG